VEHEVALEKLRRVCDPEQLGFQTTDTIEPLVGIVGQERALRALRLGLEMRDDGFNVYVAGRPGTGRTTAVMAFLDQVGRDKPIPPDWCYVNNFQDPYCPRAIHLPAGQGLKFRAHMEELVGELRRRIPEAFESEQSAQKRQAVTSAFQRQRQTILSRMEQVIQKMGFVVQATQQDLKILPIQDGRPMKEEEFSALGEDQRKQIIAARSLAEAELGAALKQVRAAERQTQEQMLVADRETALYVVRPLIEELQEKHKTSAEVTTYLDEVQGHILRNLASFRGEEETKGDAPQIPSPPYNTEMSFFRQYEVNVIVDNSQLQGAPVFLELNATYSNLFGRLEREAEFGALVADFTMLKGGILHRANGGYVVMPTEPLLANPTAWESLKRALRSRQVLIEEGLERLNSVPVKSVRAEPIPLEVKIILVGTPASYYMLYHSDPDFSELFKVKAHFDVEMERSPDNVQAYAAFVSGLCRREKLRHLNRRAVARVVEYGSRLAEDQGKLSTHFAAVADVLREASLYAAQDGAQVVMEGHIQRAIDERMHRSDILQEHVREDIVKGSLLIDTDGQTVGQVNGLSVYSLGDYEFAYPTRITASVGLGRDGVMDIDREADLGGDIHTKGVLILGGYLAGQYAQDKPLTLSARIAFEQSYNEVDGDSASSAELYTIISALSGLPIRQDIAVTGSVNQRGQIQPIGAVNAKVEGFFDICAARGLTGRQGVIIPQSNVRNLMLNDKVVEAVRQGRFHVWSIDRVDQGIGLLTGVDPGERGDDGQFPAGTVHGRVSKRLRELVEILESFGKKGSKD